jgi:hypothetical protein
MLSATGSFSVGALALVFVEVTARPAVARYHLGAISVIANGFNRAAFHRFFAEPFFFGCLRLLVNVGVAAVVIPLEVCRGGFAAQITVDALIIDIEFARYVLGIFVRGVGHVFPEGEMER